MVVYLFTNLQVIFLEKCSSKCEVIRKDRMDPKATLINTFGGCKSGSYWPRSNSVKSGTIDGARLPFDGSCVVGYP